MLHALIAHGQGRITLRDRTFTFGPYRASWHSPFHGRRCSSSDHVVRLPLAPSRCTRIEPKVSLRLALCPRSAGLERRLDMFRIKTFAVVGLVGALLAPSFVLAQPPPPGSQHHHRSHRRMRPEPPSPRSSERPPPRRQDMVWSEGYWRWTGSTYVWVEGRWVQPRRGREYVQPRWVQGPDGQWRFVPGRWQRPPRQHPDAHRPPPPPPPPPPPRR